MSLDNQSINQSVIYLPTLTPKSTSARSKCARALKLQLWQKSSVEKNKKIYIYIYIYIQSLIYVHMNIKNYKNSTKKKLKI